MSSSGSTRNLPGPLPFARPQSRAPWGNFLPRRFSDGRWYYAQRSVRADGMVRWFPVGYCGRSTCEGHAEPEMARAHFRRYLIEEQLKLGIPATGQVVACMICVATRPKRTALALWLRRRGIRWLHAGPYRYLSTRRAVIGAGWYSFALCQEHQKREWVEMLVPEDLGEGRVS